MPADTLDTKTQPPARSLSGEQISAAEIDAAAELSRIARRARIDGQAVSGFKLYAFYLVLRNAATRLMSKANRLRSYLTNRT